MRVGMLMIAAVGGVVLPDPALAQSPRQPALAVARYIDPADGLTLEAAVAQALQQEPSLRAVRTEADAAEGRRRQAHLRPNPTTSFGYQKEPGGTDNQTRIEIEWPLDLFRKTGRVAVAERELDATRQAIADRERRLAGDVRRMYGEMLIAVRELTVSDDVVAVTVRQLELVRARDRALRASRGPRARPRPPRRPPVHRQPPRPMHRARVHCLTSSSRCRRKR